MARRYKKYRSATEAAFWRGVRAGKKAKSRSRSRFRRSW